MYEAKRNALAVLTRIVKKQDTLNTKTLNSEWAHAPLSWGRAIWIEAAEAMGYLYWEWWKNVNEVADEVSKARLIQLRLELIDILHFGISLDIHTRVSVSSQKKPNEYLHQEVAEKLLSAMENIASEPRKNTVHDEIIRELERTAQAALTGVFDSYALLRAARYAKMDHASIAAYYLGKNILNEFRQENGYKAGTYIKSWKGKEDNVALGYILEDYFNRFQNADHVMKSLVSGEFDSLVRKELHDEYLKVKGNE